MVHAFEGIGRAWETKAQEITSPFSLLTKLRDGQIHYVQFLEDTGVQNGIDKIRGTQAVVPKGSTLLVFKLR